MFAIWSPALLPVIVMGTERLCWHACAQIHPWTVWVYWISPLQYAQQAVSVNEFLAGPGQL